jgi:hypothetical protein
MAKKQPYNKYIFLDTTNAKKHQAFASPKILGNRKWSKKPFPILRSYQKTIIF